MGKSLLQQAVERVGPDGVLKALTPAQRDRLKYEWAICARPEQLPPAWRWRCWLLLAGRGFGKTRTGAETTREWIKKYPYVNLIGATVDDARDIMIEGESGILNICPNDERPRYIKSDRQLHWPNGAKSLIFTADEPERLRGKQHMKVWADEVAAWRYEESWTQMLLGLRLGDNPQVIATTTARATDLIRKLNKAATTHTTPGSTFDNRANLSVDFITEIVSQYEGTRLERQEIYSIILDDVEGALWAQSVIDKHRVKKDAHETINFTRLVVGVDPAGSAKKTADEAGIVVAGIADCACKGTVETHGFVLKDLTDRYSPADMGAKAIGAYHHWQADRLVAEDNFGGQIIADIVSLIDKTVAYKAVHASRGKIIRAEPIAALYEQGKVHHVGLFPKLEHELTTYTPLEPKSPGRLDALVWALTDLMLGLSAPNNESTYDAPMALAEGDTAAERALNSRVDEICS